MSYFIGYPILTGIAAVEAEMTLRAGRVRNLCGVRDTICGSELYEVVSGVGRNTVRVWIVAHLILVQQQMTSRSSY